MTTEPRARDASAVSQAGGAGAESQAGSRLLDSQGSDLLGASSASCLEAGGSIFRLAGLAGGWLKGELGDLTA